MERWRGEEWVSGAASANPTPNRSYLASVCLATLGKGYTWICLAASGFA